MDVTKNPCLITAASASDTTLEFPETTYIGKGEPVTGDRIAFIKVVTGTFKFSVGSTADSAACPSYTSSDTIPPITFSPSKQIHFKAANTDETFNISV